MRWFFIAVGVLAWMWALAVLWLFAEGGGALTIIAAGIFAVVAIVALGTERILKTLEEIRDGSVNGAPRNRDETSVPATLWMRSGGDPARARAP